MSKIYITARHHLLTHPRQSFFKASFPSDFLACVADVRRGWRREIWERLPRRLVVFSSPLISWRDHNRGLPVEIIPTSRTSSNRVHTRPWVLGCGPFVWTAQTDVTSPEAIIQIRSVKFITFFPYIEVLPMECCTGFQFKSVKSKMDHLA